PGRSNALAIAARLGLSEEIISDARRMVGAEQASMEGLLGHLQRERDTLAHQRLLAEAARVEADSLRARLEVEAQDLAARKDSLLAGERERLLERVRDLEERLAEAERALERADRQRLAEVATRLKATRQELTGSTEWQPRPSPDAADLPRPARPARGDRVRVRGMPQSAEVLADPIDDEVEVLIGILRTKLKLEQVEAVLGPAPRSAGPSLPMAIPRPSAEPATELHLRGMRVEEALGRLERFLDEAFLAGEREVRIVHGKGTGTLRQAVREELARSPLVRAQHTADPRQGGEGVTVVELAL
ncbi:MAG: hypothetical protein FJ315_08640, partial [SAR202 cluster bacterium]|nr:hypothetical protein [SAR202 cluster bacterium]